MHTLALGATAYPPALRAIPRPPACLYLRGEPDCLAGCGSSAEHPLRVAVVGSRAATTYGREQARRFGAGLAVGGAVVVSGGARGIDRMAMEGALSAGGAVVGVLGSGLDRPYPPELAPLFEAIVASGGCVLTEFPAGTPPSRHTFPQRNRLISGLCSGVLVVEAAPRSGSLITVNHALEQGRDVFALPGPVDSLNSRGVHRILREGALLVESPGEILSHYAVPLMHAEGPVGGHGMTPLLEALSQGPLTFDDLAARLKRSPVEILPELAEEELRGRVARESGGRFRLLVH